MTAEDRLVWLVEARQPQRLAIEVRGPDVAWMDGNRDPSVEHDDDAVPDLVERWARGVNLGLFGGPSVAPESCSADARE